MTALGVVMVLAICRLLWPGLVERSPLPAHVLPELEAIVWLAWLAKLVSVPVVALTVPLGLPVIAGVAGLLGWARRDGRPGLGSITADASYLVAVAVVLAVGRQAPTALGLGLLVAIGLVVLLLGVLWASWGLRPRLVWMRRPSFQVLGDNPDALTAVGRVRVNRRGARLRLRDIADGPITVSVYTPNLVPVAHLAPSRLTPLLHANGGLSVGLGGGGDDVTLPLDPGRYWVSVRFYRPHRADVAPPEVWRSAWMS